MPPKITPLKKEVQKEEEELDNLVYLRNLEKDRLDRFKVTLESARPDERTATAVKVHQRKLDACNDAFNALQQRIFQLAGTKRREEHKGKSIEFETLFDELAMALASWVPGLDARAAPANALAPSQPIVIQQPLPRIIPTFDGRYENWERFKTIFRDVVDSSSESPRMKLYHLESALTGDAAGLLDPRTIQDGNYEHAWEILKDRFEDKRRMVDLHLGGLLNVKKLPRTGHADLRSLVDNIVGHVENLKFLGQQFTGVSELFVLHLLGLALDAETKKLWESTVKKGELPKYDETIQFLKDRVSVLERCETSVDTTADDHHREDPKPRSHQYQIANTAITSQPGPVCDFCHERHLTFKCPVFNGLTVHQRMRQVKKRRVCYNCLRGGHTVNSCRQTKTCGKCHRRHHTLLHDFYRKSLTSRRPPVAGLESAGPVPQADIDNPIPMLQTAIVKVHDADHRPVPCRILLDTGSQVNLISKSMASRLKLNRVATNVPVCGIGGELTSTKESITVHLQSKYSSFETEVDCLIVPQVSAKIPPSPVNTADWPIPEGFFLADPKFHVPDRIDMLIGASLYFRLLKKGSVHMWDNYPELQETHLGWVVVGGNGKSVADQ